MTDVRTRKKLIEVALPLDAINVASAREKSIRHGHPSTLHLWWARRPLAAARAVIFAQMVDDPSAVPEEFPTEDEQERERQRLFRVIEELVLWENTTNEVVLDRARAEIRRSWKRACADNANHPQAAELFDPAKLPAFHDPFAGGGALPLEAQRLGLEAYASDLNPVAVLINKAMIEIPPKFAGQPPVNPEARKDANLFARSWNGAHGLAEDVRHYGQWTRDEAEKRIGHLYPKVDVTIEMAEVRPDLKPYVGRQLTVIAWIWARTVKSPNPAFTNVDVPLASTFMLSAKEGKEAYVAPLIEASGYRFTVRVGKPQDVAAAKNGTKLSRGANFRCLMSGTPISGPYIKAEGKAGRMGARLMAIVAQGDRGRVYVAPAPEHEAAAATASPTWRPELTISGSTQYLGIKPYGMDRFDQLFTSRQLVALTTFSDLVQEARVRVRRDAANAGLTDEAPRRDGGSGAMAYADAVSVLLAFVLSKQADLGNSLCRWEPIAQCPRQLFGRQAIPMVWDYAEGNPIGSSSGAWVVFLDGIVKAFAKAFNEVLPSARGQGLQADARTQRISTGKLVSTDPPYYDNVPYADLSDFFYVWMRRSLRPILPDLFATLAVPKVEELVAFAYRHDGRLGAETFFLEGMTHAMHRIAKQAHPAFPVSIYYAFKQSESDAVDGTASTGWEVFLESTIRAGFATSGTWPVRTENDSRMRGQSSNALASSIVLVCHPSAADAPTATRRELVSALKKELPLALGQLQRGNIAPVDLAQAAIGPGMAVFTRYTNVLDAEGKPLSVREALMLINQTLDEAMAEQEGDFDADTRWALTWFDHQGFAEGTYGTAETLATARNTSVLGLVEAGIAHSTRGKVRLLTPAELPSDWDPTTDRRLTHWDAVHHLIRVLEADGEAAAADIVQKLGSRAETARELAYRLYTICERKNRAKEALSYNGLVQSWPEMQRLARTERRNTTPDTPLFGEA